MRKQFTISLVAGGLMAAMLPGGAVAQMEGGGDLLFSGNSTCEFGQESPRSLPPCETDENGVVTLTFTNPQDRSGPFDGFQFLEGTGEFNLADGTFNMAGYSYFAGEVEGCGSGTVYFDWEAVGVLNEEGLPTFDVNRYTSAPGGTLPISATIDETPTETPNGDGTSTTSYVATYTCDEVPAAEADAGADAEDTADAAEEQAEEKADDAEEKADEKEDELEEKADEKEEELRDDG